MGCPSEVEIGDNLTFSVCTHDPATAELTDADAVPTYRIYEDETAAAILNGDMAILDDGSTTGFYTETVACSVANGFENGKTYTVYIEATVGGATGGISYGFKASSQLTTIGANVDSILVDTGTTLNDKIDTIDTVVDAIKVKTDNLPSSIPKGVELTNFAFAMFSSQDHVTPMTGLTVSGYISKDGGAFAALINSVSAIASGVYKVTVTAGEMNADVIVLRFTATGADDVVIVIKTDS